MKKNRGACFVAVLMAFSAAASADTADIVASNNQVGAQFISTYVDYTETGNGIYGSQTGVLDTERGHVPGGALFASSMRDEDNLYLAAELARTRGYTRYTGSLQGGTYGSVVSTSGATLVDFSLRFGRGWALGDSAMAIPYAEFGTHTWDRGVNWGERYAHNYVGFGVQGQYSPFRAFVMSARLTLARTYLADIDVGGPYRFDGDLGGATLYKAGLMADVAATRHWHVNAGVDYTRFSYGMSRAATANVGGVLYRVWEPDSTTRYVTARIGLGYAF